MQKALLQSIAVPFTDDAIKVVSFRWSDDAGASIEIISKRSGRRCAVKFEHVVGLRSLDELDLASVWIESESTTLTSSWLFRVRAGGWLESEASRQDFYTRHRAEQPSEFLVAGYQECVSILSLVEPSVHELPPPSA